MFGFRIINMPDGSQVIDETLKTPYDALTPCEMIEYVEIENQLENIRKIKKREQKRQKKTHKNLFYRIACLYSIGNIRGY